MTTQDLVALPLAGAVIGFLAGFVTARIRQSLRDRERAFEVLSGGPLPDWELSARKLEARALAANMSRIALSPASDAAELREAADVVRRRGRERDAEWKQR